MTDRYAESDTWPNPPASQQPAPAATECDFTCCDAPREGSETQEAPEPSLRGRMRDAIMHASLPVVNPNLTRWVDQMAAACADVVDAELGGLRAERDAFFGKADAPPAAEDAPLRGWDYGACPQCGWQAIAPSGICDHCGWNDTGAASPTEQATEGGGDRG